MPIVGFEVEQTAQFFEDAVKLDIATRDRQPAVTELAQHGQITVDALADTWVLNLHGDRHCADRCAMDLTDAGGRCRAFIETVEGVRPIGTQLIDQYSPQHLEIYGLSSALKLGEYCQGFGWKQIARVHRQQLAGFHQGALKPPQAIDHQPRLFDPCRELRAAQLFGRVAEARPQAMAQLLTG